MKKKILLTLLATVCAFCCAFGLAACGGNDGDGGGIYLVRSDGTELSNGCSLGEFTYMDAVGYATVFDFKACTKDADGKLVDLSDDEYTVKYTNQTTDTVMDPAPTSYTAFDAGFYQIDVEYNGSTAIAYFTVNRSNKTNYTVDLSKSEWKYGEELATVSVKNGEIQMTDDEYSGVYVISEADYNEIKDDADFKNKLVYMHKEFNAGNAYSITPGTYYVHAYCRSTTNYEDTYTAFTQSAKITVKKGDLTIKNADALSAEEFRYNSSGIIGKITLNDIKIDSYDSDRHLEATAENGYGMRVSGEFVWRNPSTPIDSRNSGSNYSVTFMPDEEYQDYYNYTMANAGQVEITVYKGHVAHPHYTHESFGEVDWTGYGVAWTYDGNANDVGVGDYDYDIYVDVTRDADEKAMQVRKNEANNCVFDSVTDVGTYVYTLSLKDPVNYVWGWDDDNASSNDLKFTCEVVPKNSNMWYTGETQLVPDVNGDVWLKITQFATPYKANTLTAVKVDSENQLTDVTVSIVPATAEDDYKGDYLVIGNITGNITPHENISIKFNAQGKDGYADIVDKTISYNILYRIQTNINSETNLAVYKGTAAGTLYNYYYGLKTTVGDYKLYIKAADNNYYPVADDDTLNDLGEYDFKLELDASNVHSSVTVDATSIEFKITCIEFDCPIAAGTQLQVPVGTSIETVLASYQMENEYGHWDIEYLSESGYWGSPIGDWTIPAGETKCRLCFYNYYIAGKPAPVEFTIVGTN